VTYKREQLIGEYIR